MMMLQVADGILHSGLCDLVDLFESYDPTGDIISPLLYCAHNLQMAHST
jgi:hypothetical protein